MTSICLSIAGFDGSGGAGIQADLKTFTAFGCYGMNVLTALPVQNTCGVRNCFAIPLEIIAQQLTAIFDDITPHSIKIGMLFSEDIILLVSDFLKSTAKNIPIVLDPVMQAKSGDPLLQPQAIAALKKTLIPLATIVTPNLPEAYLLDAKHSNTTLLAKNILDLGCQAVLLKGGHAEGNQANDTYIDHQQEVLLESPRIHSHHTHGTGCTLSAAIAAGLARGFSLLDSCRIAKRYLSKAILASQHTSVGLGHGPVDHLHHLTDFIDHWLGNP